MKAETKNTVANNLGFLREFRAALSNKIQNCLQKEAFLFSWMSLKDS